MFSKTNHTIQSLVTKIYSAQRLRSRKRNMPYPTYSNKQLKEWVLKQPSFEAMYNNWKKSGQNTDLIPSIDRIDDYKWYTLDNIQLMTWKENNEKAYRDRKNGINNKSNQAVIQYSLDGKFLKKYYSLMEASRQVGGNHGHMGSCARGSLKTAGRFIWKYEKDVA